MKTNLTLALVCLLAASAARAQITIATVTTNGLNEPYGVAVDDRSNYYITDSGNNRILRIDFATQAETTLAGIPGESGSNDGPAYMAHFNNPQGVLATAVGGVPGLLVTDSGNHLLRFVRLSDGLVTTLAGRTTGGLATNAAGLNATFRYPAGLVQNTNGYVYIADWGNNVIRVVNMADPAFGVTNLVLANTTLNRPTALAFAGTDASGASLLWVSDTGNQVVKLISLSDPYNGQLVTWVGTVRSTGTNDSSFGPNAKFNNPGGLLWVDVMGLLISDTGNNSIRLAATNAAFGATNYSVTTLAGTSGTVGFTDGNTSAARFNSPQGLAGDPANSCYLIADIKNNALRRIQNGLPQPQVATPTIGWVDFHVTGAGEWVSILRSSSLPIVLNNPATIAILSELGTQTHFTVGSTPTSVFQDSPPEDPSTTVGSLAPLYRDGVYPSQVPPTIADPETNLTVKAISYSPGRRSSSIAIARFQFRTANPQIMGKNAAQFYLRDETGGADIWYTLDGSDPTNRAPSFGPCTNGMPLSFFITSNLVFKARAFKPHFQTSDTVTNIFLLSEFVANKITFGFESGEASSDFVASPGQFFYSPVTMNVLPNTRILSLQFNITVTNCAAAPPVVPGAFRFETALVRPDPAIPGLFLKIPTGMWLTNWFGEPPPQIPPGLIISNIFDFFQSLQFTNASTGLLGVGWLERGGMDNLFDTKAQDLIQYSQPHDTLFSQANGRVVLGSYAFQVPGSATAGHQYQIRIGRPSATSDGVGTPGSDVLIITPDDGNISANRKVTVGQRRYVVGDAAPFRWFNAGDFGNTNLDNSDVMQVFQSAVYGFDTPPQDSDLFDSMDSSGCYGADLGKGYWEPIGLISTNDWSLIFDGNDTSINQVAFGDGQLDVCDVYVTFRRSLDPSLTWFQRFWTNGPTGAVRAALPIGNPPPSPTNTVASPAPTGSQRPLVSFASADTLASPGQLIQIPISAKVFGSYPLRALMLSLSVRALDGSPVVSNAVQFMPNPVLGQPTIAASAASANFAGTWLNTAGLSGDANLGTLVVQIPTNASANSAYAVTFDHASASPNGLASFPKKTQTALICLSVRTNSSFGDGIPDSWRLRYFGTTNNLLSQATADGDGDGVDNWHEYLAGTDPTDPKSCLRVSSVQPASPQSQESVVHWPSVAGKQYIIERSASLFDTNWTTVSTNSGTGTDMEFRDTSGGNVRFYRVRVAQ